MPTDTERLDWLDRQDGHAVVSDDAGRWAVVTDGVQNLPDLDDATDIATSFFINKSQWRKSVREAIDAAMQEDVE